MTAKPSNAKPPNEDWKTQCIALAKTLDQRAREWRQREALLKSCITKLSNCLVASVPVSAHLIQQLTTALNNHDNQGLEQALVQLHHLIRARINEGAPPLPQTQEADELYSALHSLLDQLPIENSDAQEDLIALHADLLSQNETPLALLARIIELTEGMNHETVSKTDHFQAFMQELGQRFSDIEQHINAGHADNQHSRDIAIQINQSIQGEVSHIAKGSTESTEIEQLKALLDQRVLNISERMDQFQAEEERRIAAAENRNQRLRQRIQAMEQEAEALRNKLSQTSEQLRTDPLTGVANRYAYERCFASWQSKVAEEGISCFFALWDIDHFKKINDNFGHSSGDRVLKLVAEMLSQSFQEPAFFARVGGEEFALILPECTKEQALSQCNSARKAIAGSGFNYRGDKVYVTVSCGLCAFKAVDSQDSIFKRADRALYAAKDAGRNQVMLCQEDSAGQGPLAH